jgi:hypothetical protein
VRDYKAASGGNDRLSLSRPFNITTESLTLRHFTRHEVTALYAQHTAESGQVFLPEAASRAFELSQGHARIVNALARQLTEVLVLDRGTAITAANVDAAAEILLRQPDTHLDGLIDRLREPRVRAAIKPMLAGQRLGDVPEDDQRFVLDLGLVRRSSSGGLEVANPIYREVVIRTLGEIARGSLPQVPVTG